MDVEGNVGAVYVLPEYRKFAEEFQVRRVLGVQCALGAETN